jgi:hypothetical protein
MPEEIKPNPKQAPTQDAQLAAENIITGKEATPSVDTDADYEASKKFSVSDVDRTGAGAEAAKAATAPNLQVPEPKETRSGTQQTGTPSDYRNMAKDVNPRAETATEVDDDLVKEALEKGKPSNQ